jgi:hypothetical protein
LGTAGPFVSAINHNGDMILNAKLKTGPTTSRLATLLLARGTPNTLCEIEPREFEFSRLGTGFNTSHWLATDDSLLLPVEMMVDGNRDGEMSFTDAAIHDKDSTSEAKPFRFWLNDDNDATSQKYPEGEDHPTSSTKDHANNTIESRRYLEYFTRLWINFKGITEMVKSQGFQLQLEWKPMNGGTAWANDAGNPAIKVYKAVEPDGGKAYVEDEGWAQQQLVNPYNTAYGQAGRGAPLTLPLSQVMLANLSESQPNLYLLFEGVSAGKGRLVLNLIKGGQKIGEYPPLHLDLRDIKSMYQRQDLTGKNQ